MSGRGDFERASSPPAFSEAFLAWLLPARDRESITGDLAEGYRSVLAEQGIARARRWLQVRRPGFSAVVVLTMAVGTGAATGVFGVVHGVLLRPLPWSDADRIWYMNGDRAQPRSSVRKDRQI